MSRQKILVVRADRIGDVVLSTPVLEALKKHYTDAEITVLVKKSIVPLVEGLPSVDHVMVYDPEGVHNGIEGFFKLVRQIRSAGFKIAVVLQSQRRIAAALYAARIPYRVGPLSKLHSYLFFNRGIRQRRSHVEMHEADYNLQLLRRLGIRSRSREFLSEVSASEDLKVEARNWLTQQLWDGKTPIIAIHPGMGGSALNWPETYYADLIRRLSKEGRTVMVTQGPMDYQAIRQVKEALGGEWPERVIFYNGEHAAGIGYLAALISFATVVLAPSTGPLHMASALGRRTVSLFPPIRVQSAVRWGPYIVDDSRASVLVPEVYCGQDFTCKGEDCVYFPCMRSITVSQAADEVKKQLERERKSNEATLD